MTESIDHKGIVDRIEGDIVFVRIVQQSACAGCHAKSICSASESKEKIIEVTDCSGRFHLHEEVIVSGRSSLGLQAVLLAFVIPLLIVIAGIAASLSLFGMDETTSGLLGLSLLIPYYYLVYLMRDKLKKRFIFTLKNINHSTL